MTGELMDAGYCLAELRRVASADDFRLNLAHRGRLRLIEALVAAGYSGGAAADSWLCTPGSRHPSGPPPAPCCSCTTAARRR